MRADIRTSGLRVGLGAVTGLLMVAALSALHGTSPWAVLIGTQWYTDVGVVACGLQDVSTLLDPRCSAVGLPAGAAQPTGFPYVALARLISSGTGLSAAWGVGVASWVLFGVALAGGAALLRGLRVSPGVALVGSFVYLVTPTVVAMNGFGGTFWGVVLLPAALALAWTSLRVIHDGPPLRVALVLLGWTVGATLLLPLDGYSFLMYALGAGALTVVTLWRPPSWWRAALGVLAYVGTTTVAYLVYLDRFPATTDWVRSPIELFRAMGADVVTFLVPSTASWWAKRLGVGVDSQLMWGDGSNVVGNYLGYGLLLLAALGLVVALRGRTRGRRALGGDRPDDAAAADPASAPASAPDPAPDPAPAPVRRPDRAAALAVALVAMGLAGLVLSLGPSLKFDDLRGPLTEGPTFASYLMTEDQADLTLPTTWLYENVPGFDLTRSTYRWIVLTRIALVALAALGAQRLLRLDRRWTLISAVVIGLAVAEVAPDLARARTTLGVTTTAVRAFDAEVVAPLDEALPTGARVVFAPNNPGANDFLANYLAPLIEVRSFNVGGDKALHTARGSWPQSVELLLTGGAPDFSTGAYDVLRDREADVDVVVLPFFDLYASSGSWPPAHPHAERGIRAWWDATGDSRLTVETHERFALVRLAEDAGD